MVNNTLAITTLIQEMVIGITKSGGVVLFQFNCLGIHTILGICGERAVVSLDMPLTHIDGENIKDKHVLED